MNNNDPLSKSTVALLRADLPASAPRPGLDTRLLTTIRTAGDPPERSFLWIPLAAMSGAAALALLALLNSPSTPHTPPVATAEPPLSLPTRPVLDLDELTTPLETEAVAIRSSATRAGRFLISCLPSLPDPEGAL